jgi:hypothetical protein
MVIAIRIKTTFKDIQNPFQGDEEILKTAVAFGMAIPHILLTTTGKAVPDRSFYSPHEGEKDIGLFIPGHPSGFELWNKNHPETGIVVAVVGLVVVAVSHAAIPCVVVPASAPQHAGLAIDQ